MPQALLATVATVMLVSRAWAELTETGALERAFAQEHWELRIRALEMRLDSSDEFAAEPDEHEQNFIPVTAGENEADTGTGNADGNEEIDGDSIPPDVRAGPISPEAGDARPAPETSDPTGELYRASLELATRDYRYRVRERFYSLVVAQERFATIDLHLDKLQETAGMVEERFNVGMATELDHRRVRRELELARSRVADASARREQASIRLFSLIGGQPDNVSGELLPPDAPSTWSEPAVLEGHPALHRLSARIESTRLAANAARRLGLEVPAFGTSVARSDLAEASRIELEAKRARAAARLIGTFRSAVDGMRAHAEAARHLEAAIDSGTADLSNDVREAYEDGEVGLIDLVDASRSELDARLEVIEHARQAREDYIRLQWLVAETD